MNLGRYKEPSWFDRFINWTFCIKDNRIKTNDLIHPDTLKAIKEINEELPKLIENLKKLKDELQAS